MYESAYNDVRSRPTAPVLQSCNIIVFTKMFPSIASVLRAQVSRLLPASGCFDSCILPIDL